MPRLTILFGVLLILLGAGGYFGPGRTSVTALIPAFFGVPFLLLGLVALKDGLRKHAMHAASLLALLGVVGALFRPVKTLLAGAFEFNTAVASQFTMAALCVVFLGLCIKSFVDARVRRKPDAPGEA